LNKFQTKSVAGYKQMIGVMNAFAYDRWDADSAQSCICDAGYGGSDCSQRLCPRNDDPLTSGSRSCGGKQCSYEVQSVTFMDAASTLYRITFTDGMNASHHAHIRLDIAGTPNGWVNPALSNAEQPATGTIAALLRDSLRSLPFGGLSKIEVTAAANAVENPGSELSRTFRVKFVGVGGTQELLSILPLEGPGTLSYNPDSSSYDPVYPTESSRSVVRVTIGTYEEIECGGRGVCDRSTGICTCTIGFTGEA
jgi:EGF-like domain